MTAEGPGRYFDGVEEMFAADHTSASYVTADDLDALKVEHDETRRVALKAVKGHLEVATLLRTLNSLLAQTQQALDDTRVNLQRQVTALWALVSLLTVALIVVAVTS